MTSRVVRVADHDLDAPIVWVVRHAEERAAPQHLRADLRVVDFDGHSAALVAPRERVQILAPLGGMSGCRRAGDAQPELERVGSGRWWHGEHGLRRGVHNVRGDASDKDPFE